MTKYLITLFVLLLIASCDDDSASNNSKSKKSKPQTLLSKKEKLAHDFENNKLTNPFDFFNGVVAEYTLIHIHLVGIMKLNENNATAEEIIQEAKRGQTVAKRVFKKLKKIKAIGDGGSTLLTICTKYAQFTELVCNDIVANNGKFDFSNVNVPTLVSCQSDFVDYQKTYASNNNFKLGADINLDEMYEDSKKTHEDDKTKKKN